MSDINPDLKYVKTHEWIRLEADGTVTIGITDHAQSLLGDVVFVELPEIENEVAAGAEAGVVESVKAASDIYAPISGEIIEVNEALESEPELINSSPYEDGWILKMQPSDPGELDELLDADEYKELVDSES